MKDKELKWQVLFNLVVENLTCHICKRRGLNSLSVNLSTPALPIGISTCALVTVVGIEPTLLHIFIITPTLPVSFRVEPSIGIEPPYLLIK